MRSLIKFLYYRIKYYCHFPSFFLNKSSVGRTNRIAKDVSLKKCHIGEYNYIATRCSFYNVVLGNYCCIGPDTHIGGMQHPYWDYCMSPLVSNECQTPSPTKIGHDVWIGAGCIIKQGIQIGDGAVIGANSFVNKNVDPYSIVAGSPAKEIKKRFDEKTVSAIERTRFWLYSPKVAKRLLFELKERKDEDC